MIAAEVTSIHATPATLEAFKVKAKEALTAPAGIVTMTEEVSGTALYCPSFYF